MVLSLAMMLTFVPVVHAEDTSVSLPMGTIIANNYSSDLSDEEKAILNTGLLIGGTVTYEAPAANDDGSLVKVNADEKSLLVEDYKDGLGNVWTPISVKLVYEGGSEVVTLNAENKGTYKYDGNSFSVETEYALDIDVDVELQNLILNAPNVLAQGIDNLESLKGQRGVLNELVDYLDTIKEMVDGIEHPVFGKVTLGDESHKAAVYRLWEQSHNNDSGNLTLSDMINEYRLTDSVLRYLFNNGEAIRSQAAETYEDICLIKSMFDDEQTMEAMSWVMSASELKMVNLAIDVLSDLADELEVVINDPWTALTGEQVLAVEDENTFLALDGKVEDAIGNTSTYATEEPTLRVATQKVITNLNRYNVNVVIKATVMSGTAANTSQTLSTTVVTLPMGEGTTATDVKAAVEAEGIEADALKGWATYAVNTDNYVREESKLDDALTKDVDYVITYSPKEYPVTVVDGEGNELSGDVCPYGYVITLPAHENVEKVYDYEIGGENYFQGDEYFVAAEMTIIRTEGKPWTEYRVADLLANMNEAYGLSQEAAAILKSVALHSDIITVRVPDDKDKLVSTVANGDSGYIVTAKNYSANVPGLTWKAVSIDVVGEEGGVVENDVKVTDEKATIASNVYDHVEVTYELVVDTLNNEVVLNLLNLPHVLAGEAEAHLADMAILTAQTSRLGQLNGDMMGKIQAIKGSFGVEAQAAIDVIVEACINQTSEKLYLYEYLSEYMTGGLGYLYQDSNYTKIQNQVNAVNANLTTIYNDPQFDNLLTEFEMEDKKELIKSIMDSLEQVHLQEPNAAIDVESASLGSLATAIESAIGKTAMIDKVAAAPVIAAVVSKAGEGRVSVSISVQIKDGTGKILGTENVSKTFQVDEGKSYKTLTAADIEGLLALVAEKETLLGVNKTHYESVWIDTELIEGTQITSAAVYSVSWVPKTYSVSGDLDVEFSYDNPTITLPKSDDAKVQYKYIIGDREILVGNEDVKISFTEAEIEKIAAGELKITRVVIDVYQKDLETFVSNLDKDLDGLADVVPVRNAAGEIVSIVLRLNVADTSGVNAMVQNLVGDLMGTSFKYIMLGDSYLREDAVVSVQAMVDMVLNSDLGMDKLLGIIDANGKIVNELQLDSALIIDTNESSDHLGGELIKTTLNFSATNTPVDTDIDFYVTLQDFGKYSSQLKQVREALVKVQPYVNIYAGEGQLNIDATFPDNAYEAFTAAMLILGEMDMETLQPVEAAAFERLVEMVKPLIEDETISIETYENTLKELGRDTDLSQYEGTYEKVFKVIRHLQNNGKFTVAEDMADQTYAGSYNYDMNWLLDKAGAGSLSSIVKENESGINLAVNFELKNQPDYAAMIIDVRAEALLDKAMFVRASELEKAVSKLHDTAVVVLLSDVDSLNFVNTAILDLNGNNVNTLTAKTNVKVVDSTLATAGAGTVENISGNFTIMAGSYKDDVTSMLPAGYVQEDGLVSNVYYQIEEDKDTINVIITAGVDNLKGAEKATLTSMLYDLAFDLALNYYTSASLSIGGNNIYAVEANDLVDLAGSTRNDLVNVALGWIDCEGVTALANDLLDKLCTFGDLQTAIDEGEAFAAYSLATNAWDIAIEHKEGNYITASILPGKQIKEQKIAFYLESPENEEISGILGELEEIADVDVNITEFGGLKYEGGLKFNFAADIDATISLNHDADYVVMIAVVLVNTMKDAAKKADLVAGIQDYIEFGTLAMLKEAMDAVSTSDVISALKALGGNVSFDQMLKNLGLEMDNAQMTDEHRLVLKAVCALLRRINVTGGNQKLGQYETDEQGVYRLQKENWNKMNIDVTLNLFGEVKESFEVIVLTPNRDQVGEYHTIEEAMKKVEDNYILLVQKAVALAGDVNVDITLNIEGAANIDQNGYNFVLTAEGAKLVSDAPLSVVSGVDGYEVEATDEAPYTYTLKKIVGEEKYEIQILDTNKDVVAEVHTIEEAMAAMQEGYTLVVLAPVTMTADASVSFTMTVEGAANVDQNGYSFVLTAEGAKIISDAALAVVSGVDGYEVEATDEAPYTYTLKKTDVIVEEFEIEILDDEDNLVGQVHTIEEAMALVQDWYSLNVLKAVVMKQDAEVNVAMGIFGAANIDQNGYSFVLTNPEGSTLVSDVPLNVTTNVEGYLVYDEIVEVEGLALYVYMLLPDDFFEEYEIGVYDDNYEWVGDFHTVEEAMEAIEEGYTMVIYAPVVLTADVPVGVAFYIDWAENIDQNGYKFILNNAKAAVMADVELVVASGLSEYVVVSNLIDVDGYEYYAYTLKMKVYPKLTGVTVTVNTTSGNIRGYKLQGSYLYLDTIPTGLTVTQFKSLAAFTATDADQVTVQVTGASGKARGNSDIIRTGDKVKVVASNEFGKAEAQYTIIVMGDVNLDGAADAGDAAMIARYVVGKVKMSDLAILASDMNQNGDPDVGDAAMIARKYTHTWKLKEYKSSLKA